MLCLMATEEMTTGRRRQRAKQIGEALAVAELGRRGWIAASFSGNVPVFDILASNENYETIHVQVKASNGQDWHINDVRKFIDIEMDTPNERQIVKGKKPLPKGKIFHFFIMLNGTGKDDFYIIPQKDLQDIIYDKYSKKHTTIENGKIYKIRPENWKSPHSFIAPEEIKRFKENWDVLNK